MTGRALVCACALMPCAAYAQNAITLPPQDRPVGAREVQLYSIGRMDGAAWEVFGGTLELEFGTDGSLYVLDRDNAAVHSFDSHGVHRWSAGRFGAGPGELSNVTFLAVLPAGDVVIADFVNARMERFTAAGRYAGTISLPAGMRPRRIHAAGDSAVWFIPTSSGAQRDSLPVMRVTLDARARVVLGVPVTGPAVQREGATYRRTLPPTFSPQLRTAAAGARLAVAYGADYRVTVTGAERTVLVRSAAARAVTSADRDAARARVRQNAANVRPRSAGSGFQILPSDPAAVENQIRQMTFAETIPVIQELRGAPDGTLWVARTGAVAFQPGPIDVIGPDLRYVGTLSGVRMPAAIGPGGRIAVVATNELDVPVIRVSRIEFQH